MPLWLLKHNKINAQEAGFSLAGFLGNLYTLTILRHPGCLDLTFIGVDLRVLPSL